LAPGRGLGASGGGIGRVAEGASGISSGFCCAAAVPVVTASNVASSATANPGSTHVTPAFRRSPFLLVAIPNPLSFCSTYLLDRTA